MSGFAILIFGLFFFGPSDDLIPRITYWTPVEFPVRLARPRELHINSPMSVRKKKSSTINTLTCLINPISSCLFYVEGINMAMIGTGFRFAAAIQHAKKSLDLLGMPMKDAEGAACSRWECGHAKNTT
jgi:hypothetical protein